MIVRNAPALIPELDVTNLDESLRVYVDVFGFSPAFRRREERFAYLVLGGAHLMLEEIGPGQRRFSEAEMTRPFGRGVNFQILVEDVAALYGSCLSAGLKIALPIEDRWYRQDDQQAGNRQFVVQDPDGYLMRFYSDLGFRPVSPAGR